MATVLHGVHDMKQLVRDVMTRSPITIDPDAPVATAVAVMRERDVRHLPVADGAGRVLGVVSDRDLRSAVFAPALAEFLSASSQRRFAALNATLEELRVRDVMTWDVITVRPEGPVAEAAAIMFERRIGCLPVLQAGRLVGIVTERDVLRALAATIPAIRGDPDTYFW